MYLVFEVFSDKSGAFLFLPWLHKHAVAHIKFQGNPYGPVASCLVFRENLHVLMALNACQKLVPDWHWSMDGSSQAGNAACTHKAHEAEFRLNQSIRQEKRPQRLTVWVRRLPGGVARVGVFHAKGWWPKSSCPASKVCLPWVSKRGIWDVPGILPGCPGPLGVFKKLVQKGSRAFSRSKHKNCGNLNSC